MATTNQTMQKFTKILKDLNKSRIQIAEELQQTKGRSSAIVNTTLTENYPTLVKKTSKEFIKAIWTDMLTRAPRKMSRAWVSLFTELDKLLKVIYSNPLTLRGFLSELRKPLKDAKWDPEIYKQSIIVMGMDIEQSKEIARQYKAQVEARNVNRGDRPPIYVEDVFALLDNLIQSQNAYELTLAVELATGSRSIEVFKVSEYRPVLNHPEQILVRGIAKDTGGNDLQNVVLTRNLVRLNSKQVIDAVQRIRQLVNVDGDNKKISQRTNKHVNAKFKEFVLPLAEKNATPEQKQTEEYKNYIKSFTSHKTRYIYATSSYLIYGKPKNIPYEMYIQAQLGHLSSDSTRSYLGVNIKFRNKLIKNIDPQINESSDPVTDFPDLRNFKNSFSRAESFEAKIQKVVDAIKLIKSKKVKMPTQSELGRQLAFGSEVMSKAYRQARELNLMSTFNTTNRK